MAGKHFEDVVGAPRTADEIGGRPVRGAVPDAGSPPGTYGRAAAWLSKQVELALADVGLSLPQYRILGLLGEGAAMPSALADRLTVARPTVTAVVDGLEARDLVERAPGPVTDRRRVTHTLTTEGRQLLARADAAIDARLADIAASLDGAELTDRALHSLELWGTAMWAHHARRTGAP